MSINQVYKNKETEKLYVLFYPCKVKNPKTREWEDGYVYGKSDELMRPIIHVRSVSDFEEKFQRIGTGVGIKFIGLPWPNDRESMMDWNNEHNKFGRY